MYILHHVQVHSRDVYAWFRKPDVSAYTKVTRYMTFEDSHSFKEKMEIQSKGGGRGGNARIVELEDVIDQGRGQTRPGRAGHCRCDMHVAVRRWSM
jgi:hypothetical protein